MKLRSRAIIILTIVFTYIILQFIWWEILLVKQTGQIIDGKQKLTELASTDPVKLAEEVNFLHQKKKMQVMMIVGEGTVFLLLLLFGIYKIRQAHSKEMELNNRQRNFFLSITHELKTPIAATKLQLQTLQKHKLDEQTKDQLLQNALNETERLNLLIDNLLLAGRMDSGEYVFKKENANLSQYLTSLVERYYKQELSGKTLILDVEPGIYLNIDKNAFPSIITNLVDNALKYSPNEKKIEVVLKKKNNTVVLSVSDMGVGVADTEKQKVFDRFYRAGNEETRSTKGTGLGLYIVSYMVNNHSGKITLKNNQPKGSIFEIEFYVG